MGQATAAFLRYRPDGPRYRFACDFEHLVVGFFSANRAQQQVVVCMSISSVTAATMTLPCKTEISYLRSMHAEWHMQFHIHFWLSRSLAVYRSISSALNRLPCGFELCERRSSDAVLKLLPGDILDQV
jgi:hypothetical protein